MSRNGSWYLFVLDPFAGNFSDPQSLHKYLYTHGDPVNGVDPTGRFSFSLGAPLPSLRNVMRLYRARQIGLTFGAYFVKQWDADFINVIGRLSKDPSTYTYRNNYYGFGGKDVTRAVIDALRSFKSKWGEKDRWQKLGALAATRKPLRASWPDWSPMLSSWDIGKFHTEARKTVFHPGGSFYAAETVTVQGDVHITHEVNYILFGYAYGVAYKEGFGSIKYGKLSTLASVAAHKSVHFLNIGKGHMGASMAWTEAGWNYAQTGKLVAPRAWRLRNVEPSSTLYTGGLFGHFGDPGGANSDYDVSF